MTIFLLKFVKSSRISLASVIVVCYIKNLLPLNLGMLIEISGLGFWKIIEK